MLTHIARLAGLTALLALLIAPSAHAAQFRVGVQVGAPVVVAPVYRERVWQPGYYVRTGYGRRWVPGMWIMRERGRAYGYWRDDRRWRR
jgi:hypothetical protein